MIKYALPVLVERGEEYHRIMVDGIRYIVMRRSNTDWQSVRNLINYKPNLADYAGNIIIPKIHAGDISVGTRRLISVMTQYFITRSIKLEEGAMKRKKGYRSYKWLNCLYSADEIMKNAEFESLPYTTLDFLRIKYQGTKKDILRTEGVYVNPPIEYPK